MPYTLEIHHIDVGQGDSTLVLVRDEGNANAITTSVLIDGGLGTAAATVHAYLVNEGVASLNYMVASHFDKDHYYGLTELLEDANTNVYDNVRVYDRGEVGSVDRFGNVGGRKDDFARYVQAVGRVVGRQRPTGNVITDGAFATLPQNWEHPTWLIDRTIFSLNNGATSMTCLVANKYVSTANNYMFVFGPQAIDDNPMSLGFLIRHGNFRYFTAGDLTIPQEEAVSGVLNANNNDAGHVCAVKASHHGAAKSSSANYMNRMRPRAAFISCGYLNGYGHPTFKATTNIENSPRIQYYYLSSCGTADNWLLGCSVQNQNQMTQNSMARVAGDRPRGNPVVHRGDAVLRVTSAQSAQNPHQFDVTYYEHDNNGNLTINHTC